MIHTFYSIQILFHYFTIISFLVGDTSSSSSFSSSTDGFHTVMWYTVGKKVGYLQAREIFPRCFFPINFHDQVLTKQLCENKNSDPIHFYN